MSVDGLQQQNNAGSRGGNCKNPCPNRMFNMANPTIENCRYPGRDLVRIRDLLDSTEGITNANGYHNDDEDVLKVFLCYYSISNYST